MSSNKAILILSLGWILWLIGIILSLLSPQQLVTYPALLTTGYLLGAFLFTPDLACPSTPDNDPLKYWGHLGCVWRPYRNCFKHKSVWSHGYIISALLQVVYISACAIAAYSIAFAVLSFLPLSVPSAKEIIQSLGTSVPSNLDALIFWLTGLSFGNSLHLILEHNSFRFFR